MKVIIKTQSEFDDIVLHGIYSYKYDDDGTFMLFLDKNGTCRYMINPHRDFILSVLWEEE